MGKKFWVAWVCVVAGVAMGTRLGEGAEPAVSKAVLRDWLFAATDAGAGEHPVVEAGDGTIVVGHAGGLLRFDGHRMIPLAGPIGDSPVKHLLCDASGRLHTVLADGTHLIRDDRGLRAVQDTGPPPSLAGGEGPEPVSICQAGDGSVWVGHRQGFVSQTIGLRRTWHPIPAGESESPDRSCFVAADVAGRVWLARRTRLAVWAGSEWQVEQHLPDEEVVIAPARTDGLWVRLGSGVHHFRSGRLTQPFDTEVLTIRDLAEDRAGRLWIATTRYGLVMWDGSRLATAETAGSSIYSLLHDRAGNVWAGTTAGLERGRPRIVQRVEMPTIKGLRAIRCDAEDRLWFLTLDGEVGSQPGPLGPWLRAGGRGTDATVFHSRREGWEYGRVTALTISPENIVWLGTHDGGIVRIDQRGSGRSENLSTPPELRGLPVTSLLAVADGLLVGIGTSLLWHQDNRWHPLDWPPGHPAAEVTTMAADGGHGGWLATQTGELFRLELEPAAASQPRATIRPIPGPRPRPVAITSIVPLPDGTVWIATRSDGLWRWQKNEWSQLTTRHGLPAETVLAAMPDGRGRLWCAAARLFFAGSIDELAAVADGRSDRCHCWILTRDDRTAYFDPAVVPPDIATSDRQGTILVALPTGIAACLTDRLPTSIPLQPVWLSELLIDGRPKRLPAAIAEVPPAPRLVEVLLGEAVLPVPSNARVEHQLTGIDPTWTQTPADRRLVYERLPPGRHILRLRSTNDAGKWTEAAPACTLEVAPAWWERPVVRAGALVAVALTTAAVTLSLRSRKTAARLERFRQQAILDRERMRIAQDMHDDLGTSLTQISLLADLAGRKAPAETAASLTHISRIACDTVAAFDEIVWAVNPEHDTLPHLLGYMALSASQTLAALNIECRFEMPAQVPPRTAPAEYRRGVLLIVKEAIHNAVKHAGPRQVEIRPVVVAGRLTITITDDGQGASLTPRNGPRPAAGLDNMQRRAAELGGRCTVASSAAGGTQVTLDLPLPAAMGTPPGGRSQPEGTDAT